jgi:hypothetical protein
MRRIIQKIRLQPPEFRIMVAVVAALIVTGVITAFWATTISGSIHSDTSNNTPGPLRSLISNIKDVVSTSTQQNPSPFSSPNQIQVIDTNHQSAYDESHPSGLSATGTDTTSATTSSTQ